MKRTSASPVIAFAVAFDGRAVRMRRAGEEA
jgi:hypothetical protein